jgi:hypothetical protein
MIELNDDPLQEYLYAFEIRMHLRTIYSLPNVYSTHLRLGIEI